MQYMHFKKAFRLEICSRIVFLHKISEMTFIDSNTEKNVDVILIGAGIMSATLGVLLK
jgi:phosphoribosylcarboxyaminoimidazole (NCAIR) mutase